MNFDIKYNYKNKYCTFAFNQNDLKMKTKKWENLIGTYFLALFASWLLFLPIDIMVGISKYNILKYIILNFFCISTAIIIDINIVKYFNSIFTRNKMLLRFFLESICAVIPTNIVIFIFQYLLIARSTKNLLGYIELLKTNNYFFITSAESIFIILIIEVIYMHNQHIKTELEREKFKYNQLKNQLNPHFLFNSLNISISLIKRDQDRAVKYTQKLSSVYRYVLINMESDLVSLEEEIEFIKKYIEILQIRYEEGLNVTYNIDDKLKKRIIPLSLQLLVENAVKHNSIYSENPLNIRIYTEGKQIVVANNIIKKNAVIDSTEIGLKNLNQKYNILCSKDIEIINDSKNFIVKIPLV